MPMKPKRPCAYPGCPELTDQTYCEKHRALARQQYDKYERDPNVHRTYGRAWKRIRDRYVHKHPLCECCLMEGKYVAVEEVHHILPVSKGGTHDESNLMSLCQSCHTKLHRELGDRKNLCLSMFAVTHCTDKQSQGPQVCGNSLCR